MMMMMIGVCSCYEVGRIRGKAPQELGKWKRAPFWILGNG
jgi:hypothetical protein